MNNTLCKTEQYFVQQKTRFCAIKAAKILSKTLWNVEQYMNKHSNNIVGNTKKLLHSIVYIAQFCEQYWNAGLGLQMWHCRQGTRQTRTQPDGPVSKCPTLTGSRAASARHRAVTTYFSEGGRRHRRFTGGARPAARESPVVP